MTADARSLLPADLRVRLEGGDRDAVGEWLRGEAERRARSDAGDARRWVVRMAGLAGTDRLLGGYAGWAAGIVLHLTGDATGAARELRRSARRLSGCGRPELADRVSLLVIDVLGESLELGRARRLARRLERRFRARGDRVRAGVALANLAGAEDAVDRVQRAEALWRRSLGDLDPSGFRGHLVRANLANVAALAGRFDEARRGHAEVLERAREAGLESLVRQAEVNLAEVEFAAGRVDEALAGWQRALESAVASGDELLALVAELDLATAEAEVGDREGALSRVEALRPRLLAAGLAAEEARAARLAAVLEAGAKPGSWRVSSGQLAARGLKVAAAMLVVEVAPLDPTVDGDRLLAAARRLERAGFGQKALVARGWAARRLLGAGATSRASRQARRVLEVRGASPWARLVAHQALAGIDGPSAARHLAAAIRIADRLLGRLGSIADRGAFLTVRGEVYLEAIARLLERNRARDRRRALDLLHRFRSGWLLDELSRRVDHADDPGVARWAELRRRLASLLAEVEGENEPRIRRSGLRIARALRDTELELGRAEAALARRWSGMISVGSPRLAEPVADALLERLGPGQVLLELFLDGDDLLVFRAGRGRLTATRHATVGAQIRRLVASTRFHLEARLWMENGRGAQMDRSLDVTLARLGELLLGGLGRLDDDGQATVWIAPHGELHGVPWSVLPLPDRQGRLGDRARVATVPGAGALARLLGERPRRPRSFALAGAPSPGLPAVATELDELAAMLPDAEIHRRADRRTFLELLGRHEAVHLAGHALFLDGLPSASGLRLDDGWVTVHDLAGGRLGARLVTFGVCSGGRLAARDPVRAEGFLTALLVGGVRTVVAAIAPVEDEAARRFSVSFHRSLVATGDPGGAWRAAVAEVRERHGSPALWGAFQLSGDPRPWEE